MLMEIIYRGRIRVKEKRKDRIAFIKKELNDPYLVKCIESSGEMMGDRYVRYERAYRYKQWKEGLEVGEVDKGTLAKLILISKALNKTIAGLDGKKRNMNSLVRYGISGTTFDKIEEMLWI